MARVKYLKSTLQEVIYQIRFPKILKLLSEAPAAFQEQIIKEYPIYSVQKNETVFEINGKQQQQLNENNHCFISGSGKTKINLTSSFIALSTLEYQRWEEFRQEVENVLNYFYSCYTIPGIQRIGLRYKNIITRSKLGLEKKPWSELLDASVLGPLSVRDDIVSYKTFFELKNSDDSCTNRHYELVRELPSGELSLMLDCDYYYTGFFKTDEVVCLSDKLHSLSQKFIEESHNEVLLKAMQPKELEPWSAT
jgi:uncharacterized protein (TIGR04255 family)